MKIGDPKRAWSFLTDRKLTEKRAKVDWSGIKLNHEYYNYLVCGDPKTHYLQYFIQKYISKSVSVLSLGCGNGNLERVLVNFHLPYSNIHGIDINPELTQFAEAEAKRLGYKNVTYSTADLNTISIPHSKYELIIFFHSLHHIENLEAVLDYVKKSLSPEGILLVVDFIGPTRFQWTDQQLKLTNELLELLPINLKINLRVPVLKTQKDRVTRPGVDDVIRADTSEAIRSGEIYELLKNKFAILEEKPMGGTLLSLLFDGIAGNFDEKDPMICSLIKSLQKTEELLILNNVIKSDFVFMVLSNEFRMTS